MHPRPTFFIVTEPMELALQPDLGVLLSDFRVLAAAPDYMIFDLTRRTTTARPAAPVAPRFTAPAASFYRFPAAWRRIKRGMTQHEALEVLGEPRRTEVRRDLRKPAASWFYGPADSYAIVLVDGRVFAVASRIF